MILNILFSAFSLAHAFDAHLSFYTFENKATSTFGKITLGAEVTPIPIAVPWFDWKCTGQKQIDGMLISCVRNEEKAETKIFCYIGSVNSKVRSLRFTKGDNFVSIEGRCKLDKSKPKKKVKLKKKKTVEKPEPPAEKDANPSS